MPSSRAPSPESPAPPADRPVVGRFAPSPTGPLHVGSLVAAVGSWLMARSAGGRWLLRIEDIDTPRVVPGMADDVLRTLEALGLGWDGGVVYQSDRTEAYVEALRYLTASGWVYPCGCSRKEVLEAASAPHTGDEGPVYPGICRDGLPAGKAARAWRLRVPEAPVAFTDLVQGAQSWPLARTCGDFVVRRADGMFAYQLAVVVDDGEAGVTEVVRGADLLSSAPRQLHLQRLLGLPHTAFAHLPLVTDPDGRKLSKRNFAVSLAAGGGLAGRESALLARAIAFLGQEVPHDAATARPEELLAWAAKRFRPGKIPTVPAPFLPA